MTVPATSQPPRTADLVVIGGGILGLAVARELLARHPDTSLCVLEREDRLAAHQTSHSSGVIHAGIYYAPGSLKARLCVEGARLLYAYCDEHDIEARRNGKLIIAAKQSELPRLDELERRGRANQVPGLRRVAGDEIAEIEPHASGMAALHSPGTGVVDFAAVALVCPRDRGPGRGDRDRRGRAGGRPQWLDSSPDPHPRQTAARHIACAGAWSDRRRHRRRVARPAHRPVSRQLPAAAPSAGRSSRV
jgi:glycine/D-amino acid oxidase-like deaminating enzyme